MKSPPNQTTTEIAFIGGGNMARALIGGLVKSVHAPGALRVVDPDAGKAAALERDFGVRTGARAAAVIEGAQAWVLAVKPQQMREALAGLAPAPGTVIVSIAAGMRIATLRRWLGEGAHYVRTMPNTPALLGCGITALHAPPGTPEAARALAESILAAAGATVWIEHEAQLDAVTALSGSGPAYFFLLTEVLRDAGIALGLPADVAAQLARQTCIGSAAMVAGDTDVATLRAQVTSRGGTTEAAVRHLEAGGIRTLFADALARAAARGRELGDDLDRSA